MGTVVRAVAAVALVVAGVVTLNPTLIYAGVSIGSSVLLKPKVPKNSPASADRLSANIDPRTPRKFVFGQTAMGTDIRDQEFTDNQGYLHRFIVVASHAVDSIDEIWFDDRIVWASAGGVQGEFVGYLDVATRIEGNAGNAINISPRMGSSRRYTGLAYVHLRYKLTGNTKKAESPFSQSIATRVTIVGRSAKLYDPRLDSTRGGFGSQRANDQSTWAYNPPGVTNGRNPALQLLWYLLGWRINGKLAVGKGIPPDRIDFASFITAANLCDEPVTLAAGGTERRYQSDGIFSEGDSPTLVLDSLKATMNAELDDVDGKIRLTVLHNDLASPVADFGDDDILGDFDWQDSSSLEESFNIVRGTYVDASSQSLYQMPDYPEVAITSPDGIDRIQTIDYPLVQSASQAQRLAKQWLQRAQYDGTFSAEYQVTGWKVQKGDVVRQSFKALGWTNKLFRVADMGTQMNGRVPLMLREENEAIYAWDAEDAAAVVAADPTLYDPLLDPVVQDIITPTYEDGTPIDDLRPAEPGATNTDSSMLFDPMGYSTAQRFASEWTVDTIANCGIVSTTDTGGLAVRIGDNSGNDATSGFYNKWLPYSPEDLYEVLFDVEIQNAGGTFSLGVQGVDKFGNVLGNPQNFLCASAFTSSSYVGRKTYRGYFRGVAAVTGSGLGVDIANPVPLPNGASSGFGQGGVVNVRPCFFFNQASAAGRVILHRAEVRKLDDATLIATGEWSAARTYARNEGVTYLGRYFGSKQGQNLNHTPPTTATSNDWWYLVFDVGSLISGVEVNADRSIITVDGFGKANPAVQTTTFTVARKNFTGGTVAWTLKDLFGNVKTPGTFLSATTGDTTTMTVANFWIAIGQSQGVVVTATVTNGADVYAASWTLMRMVVAPSSDNVWPDPQFNSNDHDWLAPIAAPFSFVSGGASSGHTYDKYIRVASTPSGNQQITVMDLVQVRYAGEKFWMGFTGGKTSAGTGFFGLWAQFTDPTGAPIGSQIELAVNTIITLTGDWAAQQLMFQAPSGAGYVKFGVLKKSTMSGATGYMVTPFFQRSQPQANVTEDSQVQLKAPTTQEVFANWSGSLIPNQLPIPLQAYRYQGDDDVSATTAWSIPTASNCTVTIGASTGVISITAVTAQAFFVIQSTRDGITKSRRVDINFNYGFPPTADDMIPGELNSASVTNSSYGSTGIVNGIIVTTGSTGLEFRMDCPFFVSDASSGLEGKFRYRIGAGAWTNIYTINSSVTAIYDPDQPKFGKFNSARVILLASDGLPISTTIEVDVIVRKTGSSAKVTLLPGVYYVKARS